MAATTLRERNKTKRKAAIVDAAITLFARKGYHQATIPEIAELAEVSTRTVWLHFPTKLDIVRADIEVLITSFMDMVSNRQAGLSATDAAIAWVREGLLNEGDPLVQDRIRMYSSSPELGGLLNIRFGEVVERMVRDDPATVSTLQDPSDKAVISSSIAGMLQHLATLDNRETFDQTLARIKVYLEGGVQALETHSGSTRH